MEPIKESEVKGYVLWDKSLEKQSDDNRRLLLHSGVVENVDDPLHLGRIMVRIHGIHPDRDSDPNALLWCEPCFPAGSFNVPDVGSVVWVLFQGGNVDHPVYLGVKTQYNKSKRIKGRLPDQPDPKPFNGAPSPFNLSDRGTISENYSKRVDSLNNYTYEEPAGISVPPNALDKKTVAPNVRVLMNTPKGHTIYAVDDDENEKLTIVDRIGQRIEFYCPLTKSENRSNASRRVRKESGTDSAISPNKAINRATGVVISDSTGQFLKLVSDSDRKSCVELRGKAGVVKFEEDGNLITVQSTNGSRVKIDEGISVVSAGGSAINLTPSGRVVIESVPNATGKNAKIKLTAGGEISAQSAAGATVDMDSVGSVIVRTRSGVEIRMNNLGSITFTCPSGSKVQMDAQSGFSFKNPAGAGVTFDASGVIQLVSSGGGNLKLDNYGNVELSGSNPVGAGLPYIRFNAYTGDFEHQAALGASIRSLGPFLFLN